MLSVEDMRIDMGDFVLEGALEIAEGAHVAVMGPSGAGKSTFLNALAGFQPLSAGRLLWKGQDISTLAPAERPISMLFQDNNLFPHLSAFENVALGVSPRMKLGPDDRMRVSDALGRVGLAGYEDRRPADLSGGQQSRVALARMLLRDKPVVLLDEPFAALGPALRRDMLALVKALCEERGATALMVTHDPGDARGFGDQCVLVAEGRVAPPAPTRPFLDDPPEAMRAYLGK